MSMEDLDDVQAMRAGWLAEIAQADMVALDALRVSILGKKGRISLALKELGALSPPVRRARGQWLNRLRDEMGAAVAARKQHLQSGILAARLQEQKLDVSLPARGSQRAGSVHPIRQTIDEVVTILGTMGFALAEGPEIEDDWYNFTALNIPPEHPARQMHDTFYLTSRDKSGKPKVLRTHTSPVQIRAMLAGTPPVRVIAPGRTYRCDSDMTHTPMFHQIEGIWIDRATHFGHLKGCLQDFCAAYFEAEIPLRFRPSYFPFTEPSAEVDIACSRKGGELVVGAGDEWLEILGCGMVHPRVLQAGNIDPGQHQGFAFGMGIERLAMLKYGIADLRTFFAGDVRWLAHYGFSPLAIPSLVRGAGG